MDLSFYVDASASVLERAKKANEKVAPIIGPKYPKQPLSATKIGLPEVVPKTEEEKTSTNINAIRQRLELFQTGIISKQRSDNETTAFNLLLNDDSSNAEMSLKLITKNLISKQNELKKTQADLFVDMLTELKGFWRTYARNWNSGTWLSLIGATVTFGIGALTTEFGIGVPIMKLSGYMYGSIGGTSLLETAGQMQLSKAKKTLYDQLASSINTMINGMKYSVVGEMSRTIIKDPVIRKKLFNDIYESGIAAAYNTEYSNCYKDFDVPLKYTDQDGNSEIQFSPDFYFYNKDISMIEKLSYAKNAVTRMSKIGRISSLLAIRENHETLEKLEKLEDIIFKDTELSEKQRIIGELDIRESASEFTKTYIKDRLEDLETMYTNIVMEHKNDNNEL
ncbi:MAG: hypothetical protein GY861_10315, partial [bacterium]|nr:hypothetical protein [bacterium]